MSSKHAFAHDSSSESSGEEDDFLHPSTNPNADEVVDYNPRKRRRTGRDAKESAALGVFGSESEDEGLGKRTPLGRGFVPSSAAAPILQYTEDEVSTPRISRPSAFSTPAINGRGGNKAQAAPGVNAGSFAARMMAKMGYKEGDGLGKDGQGRSGVIEVTLRPQGVGLGAVKEKSQQEIEEEKRQAKLKGEVYEDSDEERKKLRRKKPRSGLESGGGSGMSAPRRAPKPRFRTLEEVQRAAPGLEIPEAFAPILDMTAPGQRLLTSTSGLLTPTTGGFETAELAESRKLARRAQNDLSAYVEEWKSLEERKVYIEMIMLQQQQMIDEEHQEYERMKSFADSVQSIVQAVKDLQWDPVIEALIAADNSAEPGLSRTSEELSSIAVAAVHPFLRQAAEGWRPLDDPKLNGMAPQLFRIRHMLGATSNGSNALTAQEYLRDDGSHRINSKSTTAYESMIYMIIFPKIVSSIHQTWNVYDPTPLLTLLDVWQGLLPPFVRSQILDQAVVGKLNGAVSSWNPRKRRTTELPHLWLFPWLQYLPPHHVDPKSSTGLVSDIKRKFRHLIDGWDFRKGVVPGLEQWRVVLCPSPQNDQWTPLIMNHVLPVMARFLRNPEYFIVDPNDQSPFMQTLEGVLAWNEILKPETLGQVIVGTIFPMWHNTLHQWLTVVGPNQEIGQWFEWWRDSVFPDSIKSLTSIEAEFEKGHEMINQALDLGLKAATQLPLPSQTPRISTPPLAPISPAKPAPVVEETTFRHRVEDWCIENDLQFLPEKKVLHSAGPLYRITAAGNGKNGTLAYFKGDSLFAISRKRSEQMDVRITWESADARDALLEMAWHNVK
ncbi:hypothetical protein JHW43_007444 [Diplocarpon mali]|nr:hypothetical protein JHW43_007444 [Diplocarpon mali]